MAAFRRMGEAGDVGKRRRRSRKRKTARSKHTLEADELMSEATILYARGELAEEPEQTTRPRGENTELEANRTSSWRSCTRKRTT